MPITLTLAIRNLLRHPWRSLVTVLGVATGIAAVLATMSLGENVRANLTAMLQAASGKAGLVVSTGVDGRAVFEYADVLEQVLADPGVDSAYPVLRHRAEPLRDEAVDNGGLVQVVDSGFQLSGYPMDQAAFLPLVLSAGRLPEAGSREIVLTGEFASQRDLSIGDTVTFPSQFGEVDFQIVGLLDDSEGYASTNFGRVGAVDISDLQDMLRLSGRASVLELLLTGESVATVTQERLQELLGEAYAVVPPMGVGNVATGLMDALTAGLQVLAFTLLALAGFLAFNTFEASVLERSREYALLRTICMTRAQVRNLALLEALIVSLLGVIVGVLLGLALSLLLTRFNAALLDIEVRTLVIPVGNVLFAAFIGIVVSLLAGWLPARAASRVSALTALRRSEAVTRPGLVRLGWLLILLAAACAVWPWEGQLALTMAAVSMALLFLGLTLAARSVLQPAVRLLNRPLSRLFGVAGRLGADMAARNSARNGVAMGMVVVGMALTIGVGSMVAGVNATVQDWIDTTVLGDLFITSPVSFPDDFGESVPGQIEGVDVASGVALNAIRFEPPEARARTVALILVDPSRFEPETGFGSFQFYRSQGTVSGAYQALLDGKALIASSIQERFDLGVGDSISLRTSSGFRDFEIGAVIVDFTSGGEAVVLNIDRIEEFGGGNPDLYVLTVEDGVDTGLVRDRLLELYPELHLDITLNRDYREFIMGQSRQVFATTNLLLALAIFIAALGVANTLGLNLSSRQHELAVLRTLGLPRSGVARLITAEGLVVTLTGTLAGVLAGFLLSGVVTAGASALSGFDLHPRYPWWLLLGGILASPAVALVASYFPARRAARLAPVRALVPEE